MNEPPRFTALTDAAESLVGRLAEQFMAAQRRGEHPDIDQLAAEYPQLADVIRQVFPAIALLEGMGSSGESSNDTLAMPFGEDLGDFRLLREIGRGGMGIVYEAEQRSLGRRVALKILPLAGMLDERRLIRFRNEARAAAMLKHPHIVSVYSVGCERGVHFYSMELIRGRTLAQVVRDRGERIEDRGESGEDQPDSDQRAVADTVRAGLSSTSGGSEREFFRSVARLGVEAADALSHAHQQGVVHRDIKPSNVMIDNDGHLWITDFGLARMSDSGELTMSGDLLGTLRYMSPEQLSGGKAVDERTDIYSLGITLYELSVGRPAFAPTSREALMREVLDVEPPAPRRIKPNMLRDLETILLKSIAKSRDTRYSTAAELRDDLQRFLQGHSIRARRVRSWERAWHWCRRRPGVAALLSLLLIALSLLATGGPLMAVRQVSLAKEARKNLFVSDLNLAYQAWFSGNAERAEQLLSRHIPAAAYHDDRDFVWKHLDGLIKASEETVIYRQSTPIRAMALSPDGTTIAIGGSEGEIQLMDLPSRTIMKTLHRQKGRINGLAFSSDGKLLVSAADRTTAIWDLHTGNPCPLELTHSSAVKVICLTPDGKRLVSGERNGNCSAWSLDGQRLWSCHAHRRSISDLAISPDGKTLASVSDDDFTIKCWDTATGILQRHVAKLQGPIFCVQFDPDGKQLIVGANTGVSIWDISTCEELPGLFQATTVIESLAVTRDRLLATGGNDKQVSIWDLASGFREVQHVGNRTGILALAFTPDGGHLLSAGGDGTVRVFDANLARRLKPHLQSDDFDSGAHLALSQDDRTLISVATSLDTSLSTDSLPGTLTVWDVTTGRPQLVKPIERRDGRAIAMSPDGHSFATCGPGGLRLWESHTALPKKNLHGDASHDLQSLAFSRDSRWLAASGYRIAENGDDDGIAILWDLQAMESQRLSEFSARQTRVSVVAFSHDSQWLAISTHNGVDLWKLDHERWLHISRKAINTSGTIWEITFVQQSNLLAIVDANGVVTFLDVDTGEVAGQFRDDYGANYSLAESLDGSLLVTGGNLELRFWDRLTGSQLAKMPVHMWVCSIVFTQGGENLIWGGGDGSVNFIRSR